MFNPQKQNARRGYRERAAKRPRTSPERPVVFPEEKKMNWKSFIVALAALAIIAVLGFIAINRMPTPAQVSPTQAPALAPEPTKAPEATTAPEPTKAVVLHKPAQLQTVKVNGADFGTEFDNRIAFTNGEILHGHPAPYTDEELRVISSTWVEYTIEMPENAAFAVAFGFSVDTDSENVFSPGAIIMLPVDTGVVKVKILDGELVLWRNLNAMHTDISERISTEIATGNLSIDRPLAFSFCSQEFASYVPEDLRNARQVTIVK